MKTKALYAVVMVVILLALWRIGAATYEYALWQIDRDAPTIPAELNNPPVFIPDPPPPPTEKLPDTLPPVERPAQPPKDNGAPVCQYPCWGGQIVKI